VVTGLPQIVRSVPSRPYSGFTFSEFGLKKDGKRLTTQAESMNNWNSEIIKENAKNIKDVY